MTEPHEQQEERRAPRPGGPAESGLDVSAVALEGASKRPKAAREAIFELDDVGVSYGGVPAVRDVELDVNAHQITALIGPSGCGKSTVLRCLNRMNDLIPGAAVQGSVRYHGQDLYGPQVDPVEVRKRIGMVFQKPNPCLLYTSPSPRDRS